MGKRGACLFAALFCVFLFIGDAVRAEKETRNIYIGDILVLEIDAAGLPEEELRKRFEDFEIVDLKKTAAGYTISLCTFETGEKTIFLGGKELVIVVASTLDDIERDGIFEGGTEVLPSDGAFPWAILSAASAGIFVSVGGVVLFRKVRGKTRKKGESTYQLFQRRAAALSVSDEKYLVKLTFYFKEYLENLRGKPMIGKTSSEIMEEIADVQVLSAELQNIRAWLVVCDMFKFGGAEVSEQDIEQHGGDLLILVERIEASVRILDIPSKQKT